MSYEILLDPDEAQPVLASMGEKSARIVRDNLRKLADDPYPRPGAGSGDREKVVFDGVEAYRLHISQTWTAIYTIEEDESQVLVHEITDIDDAHKRYGD